MKYAIRRGVFETNSSSTHSVQFIEKGSEVEIEGLTSLLRVTDPKEKFLLIYGFLQEAHVEMVRMLNEEEQEETGEEILDEEPSSQSWADDLREGIGEVEEAMRLLREYYCRTCRVTEEECEKLLEECAKWSDRTCLQCFEDDCLDECTCDYASFSETSMLIGYDEKTHTLDEEKLNRIFSDECEIAVGEHYAGMGEMHCLKLLF